jgi:homocysteine S-methyltransferase
VTFLPTLISRRESLLTDFSFVSATGMREALLNENKVLFLDGGLATTLESFGLDLRNSLWSASALIERPELVAKAHLQFAQAGCDIVSTASYQLTLQARPNDGEALLQRSVELARSSGARFVAGSIGSFGAYLADGSEYRGFAHEGIEFLQNFHRRRAEILWKCGVSCLLFETIPCLDESRAVLQMLSDRHVVIVSFSMLRASGVRRGDVCLLCGLSVVERRLNRNLSTRLNCARRLNAVSELE